MAVKKLASSVLCTLYSPVLTELAPADFTGRWDILLTHVGAIFPPQAVGPKRMAFSEPEFVFQKCPRLPTTLTQGDDRLNSDSWVGGGRLHFHFSRICIKRNCLITSLQTKFLSFLIITGKSISTPDIYIFFLFLLPNMPNICVSFYSRILYTEMDSG